VVQWVEARCRVLQCDASGFFLRPLLQKWYIVLRYVACVVVCYKSVAVWCSVVQCGVVCCSVLQWVAVRFRVFQCDASGFFRCVAVCCSGLRSVVECCSVMPRGSFSAPCSRVGALFCSILRCVAVCCSMLQCVSVCCSVVQCVTARCRVLQCAASGSFLRPLLQVRCNELKEHEVWRSESMTATHCNTLQHTATHCNTLQHTATHCSTLQHAAIHCNTRVAVHTENYSSKWQNTATHCNTKQHKATQSNTKQHKATHCNTLQLTAIHCNAQAAVHTENYSSKWRETMAITATKQLKSLEKTAK